MEPLYPPDSVAIAPADARLLLLRHAQLANLQQLVFFKQRELSTLMKTLGLFDGDTVGEDGTVTRAMKP